MNPPGLEEIALTDDPLLGGRLHILQPKCGFRVSTDALLLAAAIPALPGERVLELGCGVGGAILALHARISGLTLHGLEVDPVYAALAERNGARNGADLTIHLGDAGDPPAALKRMTFDHVMTNPPFFPPDAPASTTERLDLARRERRDIAEWLRAGLRRLRQGGALTVIHRVERLPEILAALTDGAGRIRVLPLQARATRPAKRVIVRAIKNSRAPFALAPPLVLHAGDAHLDDGDDFTPEASAVLRGAGALDF